jgi:hypothetical protein
MATTSTSAKLPLPNLIPSAGQAGQILTYSGSNGTTCANASDSVMVARMDPPSLEVKGNLVLNGVDLEERLKTIETVLQIPERDVKLEKNYPRLKKLYDDYIKELSKARMWEALKGEEND